jgi:hypothetical protein
MKANKKQRFVGTAWYITRFDFLAPGLLEIADDQGLAMCIREHRMPK